MIIISGDTHGDMDRLKLKSIRHNKDLTKEDVLIIAGDWGVLWGPGYEDEEKRLLDWYSNFPCTVCVVDGNHDNHHKFAALPTIKKFDNDVGSIVGDQIVHLRRGHIYTINEKSFFIFGGGLSIDKDRRVLGVSWWPEELPSREQISFAYDSLDSVGWKVDYVVTHVPPRYVIHKVGMYIPSEKYNDPTSVFLDGVENTLDYKQWFFGHLHIDVELEDGAVVGLYNKVYRLNGSG
jgi:hypothetical protein